MMAASDETYLGDGLYAHFDGFSLVLRAPRERGDHHVALEPTVYQALQRWLQEHPEVKAHLERSRW